jgi:hypothetical protein
MRAITRRRPSPALVVAVVALVAALAGTAVAGPGAETSKLNRSKVKNIANKQINKQLPWTTADLAPGAVTAPVFGTINTRAVTQNVLDGDYFEATANCQSGEKVISGGVKWNNVAPDEFMPIVESYKEGEGWFARVFNGSGFDRQVTIEAYCLAA